MVSFHRVEHLGQIRDRPSCSSACSPLGVCPRSAQCAASRAAAFVPAGRRAGGRRQDDLLPAGRLGRSSRRARLRPAAAARRAGRRRHALAPHRGDVGPLARLRAALARRGPSSARPPAPCTPSPLSSLSFLPVAQDLLESAQCVCSAHAWCSHLGLRAPRVCGARVTPSAPSFLPRLAIAQAGIWRQSFFNRLHEARPLANSSRMKYKCPRLGGRLGRT